MPTWQRLRVTLSYFFFKTPQEGAQTTICVAVDESLVNTTGLYFSDCVPKDPAPQAKDDEAAKRLWDLSAKMVGLED
ncbi:retinol dehydrogenase 14-like [Ptychodera flava]|uniref:retinol dehydrogenase 14-like n=1 Tax=Ptychodera flava TaxID=63121 RepID=UPI00396A1AB1